MDELRNITKRIENAYRKHNATQDVNEDRAFLFRSPKKSEGSDNEKDRYMRVHEEEFYYQEVGVDHMSSPPTMSHRDMARPPHEDPEYQKQLRLEATPATNNCIDNVMAGVREPNNAISQSPVGNCASSRTGGGRYNPRESAQNCRDHHLFLSFILPKYSYIYIFFFSLYY